MPFSDGRVPPSRREPRAKPHLSLAASLSGTNLERAGDHNQRVTLQAIRINGPLTRADLAITTGLTAPAVANITRRLVDAGLVLDAGRLRGGPGQPAMRLAINPDGCFSIGVNIDRDHITVVCLDLRGQVRARATKEIYFAAPDVVAAFVREEVDGFLAAGIPKARLIGLGVALPDDLGRVSLPHRPASYDLWNTVDASRLFPEFAPLPVFVENDAAAAALGELQFGHGLRSPSFFYLLISAALGGGLVIEGDYFRGAQGRSGEIGFLPIRSERTQAGSLQEAVSLSAIYERLAQAGLAISRPDQLDVLDARGLAVVDDWIETAAELLIEPFVAISCLIDPQAIFIGGRLPEALVDRLADRLNQRLHQLAGEIPSVAPVARAAMAADAAAVGAAMLPFSNRLFPSRAALMKTAESA